MNRWRRMWDAFRQDGSPDDLIDINEQELAKDASANDVVSERREKNGENKHRHKDNDNKYKDKDDRIETGIMAVVDAPVVKADENRDLTSVSTDGDKGKKDKAEKHKKEKLGGKERDPIKDFGAFDDDEELDQRHGGYSIAFFRTVIILSMLVSVLIFVFVVIGVYFKWDDDPVTSIDTDTSAETDDPIREGDRVIYIRDLDEDSGIMSTAEIYSKNGAAVVTVVASDDSGMSIGTGFILSSDGYIATACHTLKGADSVRIMLEDGRKIEAQIVGEDEFSDLALLRVYADRLVPVSLGDSDKLLVGEPVVAIGTPYSEEFSGSVFSGNVSSVKRVVSVYDDSTGKLEKKMNFVQLSATLGNGCSGCPIFDEYGRVIGILSARLGDGTNGVCFAIPINGAVKIFDSLKSNGNADGVQDAVATPAPRLGVIGASVNAEGIRGVKIGAFSDDTCDAASKLRVGDIIVSVGEKETPSYLDVSEEIGKYQVGESVLVSVYRSGQYLSFYVELTE